MSSIPFDRAADFYDDTRGFPPGQERAIAEGFVKVGGLRSDSLVLEVGIGTGRIALPLAGYVAAVHGVDISRPMLGRLHQKRSSETVFPVEGDATRLPYPDCTFDAVLSVHVFHLIANWGDAVDEVARVLKPGGRLVYAGGGGSPIRDKLYRSPNLSYMSCHGIDHLSFPDEMVKRGWIKGETYSHRYQLQQAPAELVDQIRQRVWSSTWAMSDQELAQYIAEAEAVVVEEYGDGSIPVVYEAQFNYSVFLRR